MHDTWVRQWRGDRPVLAALALIWMSAGLMRAEYKVPAWDSIPYDATHTCLSQPERTQLADALSEYARAITNPDPAAADALRAKAIALALRLDPDNKSAVILNGRFKRGGYTTDGTSSITKDNLVRLFLMQVKKMQADTSGGQDNVFAGYVLDFLASIDSSNEDLLYQTEIAQRKAPVNWTPVLAGSLVSVPTPVRTSVIAPPPGATSLSSNKTTTSTTATASSTLNFKQLQSKVNGLAVLTSDDNVLGGKVNEIIATASMTPGEPSACEFTGKVGDDMKIAMDEAFRSVKLRHPEINKGVKFVLSFDDKYTHQSGGSAGTAFAVGLLSIVDGYTLDTQTAMTGDITVDGKVRKVGGVPIKIRGAKLDGCKLVGIPVENEIDVANLMVINGYRAAAEIQIFAINTLDDAISLARQDRSEKLSEAIKVFGELQKDLDGGGSLNSTDNAARLDKVLDLAPNHLSAKYLRERNRGNAPTALTPQAALEEVFSTASPLMFFFRSLNKDEVKNNGRSQILVFTMRPATYSGIREQLAQLEKKMPPEIQNTYYAMVNLLDRMEYFDSQYKGIPHRSAVSLYNANFANDLPRRTRLEDIGKQYQLLMGELTKLDFDKRFVESQLH